MMITVGLEPTKSECVDESERIKTVLLEFGAFADVAEMAECCKLEEVKTGRGILLPDDCANPSERNDQLRRLKGDPKSLKLSSYR